MLLQLCFTVTSTGPTWKLLKHTAASLFHGHILNPIIQHQVPASLDKFLLLFYFYCSQIRHGSCREMREFTQDSFIQLTPHPPTHTVRTPAARPSDWMSAAVPLCVHLPGAPASPSEKRPHEAAPPPAATSPRCAARNLDSNPDHYVPSAGFPSTGRVPPPEKG